MSKMKLTDKDDRRLLLDAWKAVVDVQMHFNDVLMKVRNLGITLILAVFGAAAFSLQYQLYFQSRWGQVHLASAIIAFGLCAWGGIAFMDRYYNKLLAGAVAKTTALEDLYDEEWLGMTHEITDASRTVFGRPNAMTARRQMAYFLYLPIAAIGLFYIVLVVWFFQPSYTKATDKHADQERGANLPQVPRVPQIQRAPVASPGTPSAERPPLRGPGSRESEESSRPGKTSK